MQIREKQEKRRYGEIISIPQEWLSDVDITRVMSIIWINEGLGSEYKKQKKFMSEYKNNPKALIISSNGYLLDGFYTLILAKSENRRPKVILLDNVIVDGFQTT